MAFVLSIAIWISNMFPFQVLTSLVYHSALGSIEQHAFSKGLSAYEAGNYLGAIPFLKQSLNLDPRNASIITDIASSFAAVDNYSQAMSFYKHALLIDPHHKGAFLGIAEILNTIGDNKSLNYFKQSLVEPCHITKLTCEEEDTIALTHLGHFKRALSVINQVLKFRPTSIEALNMKGEILLYLGNYTGALNIINHLLITHPNLDSILVNKGIALVGLGNYKQALPYFQRAVTINNKDSDNWYDLGNVLDHEGNFTGALKAYIHAQNLAPHNKDVLWNEGLTLGIVALKSHHFADAIKVYNTMLKVEPHNSYLSQARNYAESKLFESICCVGGSFLP